MGLLALVLISAGPDTWEEMPTTELMLSHVSGTHEARIQLAEEVEASPHVGDTKASEESTDKAADESSKAAAHDFPSEPDTGKLQDAWWYKEYMDKMVPNTQNMRWSGAFAPGLFRVNHQANEAGEGTVGEICRDFHSVNFLWMGCGFALTFFENPLSVRPANYTSPNGRGLVLPYAIGIPKIS